MNKLDEISSFPISEAQPTKQYEKFCPILDRVLTRRVEDKQDGLLVPNKFRQQSNKHEVVEVGDGVYIGGSVHPIPVKPGDLILAGEYNAEKFLKDGEEFWIIRVQDIRGVEKLKR